MAERKYITPDSMKAVSESFGFSQAVREGNVLYISGQVGDPTASKEVQFTQAFENLGKVLAAANSGFEDVVDLLTFHADMRDLVLFMTVKDRYFKKDFPAWTGIGTTALARPGAAVEIRGTAVLSE